MQERDYGLDRPVQLESFYAIGDICTHPSTLVRCTAAQRESQISSGPLLHQSRSKRASQAEDQTEDPHHVNPDSRSFGLEWLCDLRWNVPEWRRVGDVEQLLGYLSEKRVGRIAGIRR